MNPKMTSLEAWRKEINNPDSFASTLLKSLPSHYHDVAMRFWRDGWCEGGLSEIKRNRDRMENR